MLNRLVTLWLLLCIAVILNFGHVCELRVKMLKKVACALAQAYLTKLSWNLCFWKFIGDSDTQSRLRSTALYYFSINVLCAYYIKTNDLMFI